MTTLLNTGRISLFLLLTLTSVASSCKSTVPNEISNGYETRQDTTSAPTQGNEIINLEKILRATQNCSEKEIQEVLSQSWEVFSFECYGLEAYKIDTREIEVVVSKNGGNLLWFRALFLFDRDEPKRMHISEAISLQEAMESLQNILHFLGKNSVEERDIWNITAQGPPPNLVVPRVVFTDRGDFENREDLAWAYWNFTIPQFYKGYKYGYLSATINAYDGSIDHLKNPPALVPKDMQVKVPRKKLDNVIRTLISSSVICGIPEYEIAGEKPVIVNSRGELAKEGHVIWEGPLPRLAWLVYLNPMTVDILPVYIDANSGKLLLVEFLPSCT